MSRTELPDDTNLPKIVVKDSGIHGTGVYAAQDIKRGDAIIEYKGEKIPSDEGTRRSEAHPTLSYIFILNDDWDIDGNVDGNNARYINHSCDPNCEIDYIKDHIWIFAVRDIKEGEELAYDYAFDADEKQSCRCGSSECRGYINDPELFGEGESDEED